MEHVKAVTNPQIKHLILLRATSKRHGDKWHPPPPSTLQFPITDLFPEKAGGGAWRTKFAAHSSPDGKPLHVALLQVTLENGLR